MTLVRPVVEASVGGVMALSVAVSETFGLAQVAIHDPAAVFSVASIWNWTALIAAGGLLWRAGALVRGIEGTLANFAEKQTAQIARQAEIDADMIRRIAANESKWRQWEPVLIEMQVRYGMERDRRDRA